MSRESFLARVRDAAQAGRAYRVPVDPESAHAGYVGVSGDLCDQLAAEVTFVGGQPHVAETWDQARQAVTSLLEQYAVKTAICWQHDMLHKLGLVDVLQQLGVMAFGRDAWTSMSHVDRKESILNADVGISSADFAIAETGTLVVCARPGQERTVSLLPPVHIAVVEQKSILPDLFDLFTELSNRGYEHLPSNIAFISGPSKTGDIELELTTGVHGPGQWHVVIVRGE